MSYIYAPGLGDAGSYQVSGKPFATGSIDVNAETAGGTGTPFRIQFPSVTSWVSVRNLSNTPASNTVRFGFSALGMFSQGGSNFVTLRDEGEGAEGPAPLELKVCEIFIEGTSDHVDVVAGLTDISCEEIPNNWSGSAGVG